MNNLLSSILIYGDRRILGIFTLGIMSGLPWVMIGSALTLWLRDAGISRTEIGFATLITVVFSVNFLWSPLIDRFKFKLAPFIGFRRSWIILCQLVIATCCFVMPVFDAATQAYPIVLIGLILATASATQDISIDAYRIDSFEQHDQQGVFTASAAATGGWWTGFAGLGALALAVVDWLNWGWPDVYQALGITTFLVMIITALLPDPAHQKSQDEALARREFSQYAAKIANSSTSGKFWLSVSLIVPWFFLLWAISGSYGLPEALASRPEKVPVYMFITALLCVSIFLQLSKLNQQQSADHYQHDLLSKTGAWLITTLVAPLQDFFKRNGTSVALGILGFIVLFKVGESFLGRMSIIFYRDIGFSTAEIAKYSKFYNWIITLACIIPCGILNAKFGIVKGLFISGCAMALSNLMFIWLAHVGPDVNVLTWVVIVDGITSSWSSIASVSFMSLLCNHRFSASQYALFASLGTFGRTTLAANGGLLIDGLDGNWALFFTITTLMVIPALLALFYLKTKIKDATQQ